jgi:flagellar hook assembly protein FlgD
VGRNPARAPVSIQWWTSLLASGVDVSIRIHDLSGRIVRSVPLPAGRSGTLAWNGEDQHGHAVPPGIYFVALVAPGASVHRKLVLLSP